MKKSVLGFIDVNVLAVLIYPLLVVIIIGGAIVFGIELSNFS